MSPNNQDRQESKAQAAKRFKATSAKSTGLPRMAKGARNSLILTLAGVVSLIFLSTAHSSPHSPKLSSRYSSAYSLSAFSTSPRILSAAPCTLETPYPDQPSDNCQGVYDLHRLTVFLIAASALQTLLLAFIAMMLFRQH